MIVGFTERRTAYSGRRSFAARLGVFENNQQGAYMVELAITIPLFLGLLFAVIDMSRVVVGYATVRSAAATGARFAVASRREKWKAIQDIEWTGEGYVVMIGPSDENLTAIPEFRSGPNMGSGWYDNIGFGCMTPPGGGNRGRCGFGDPNEQRDRRPLFNLYQVEVQAIAYANLIMARNLGSIKYPCRGEPGCARCFTLRGDSERYDKYFCSKGNKCQGTSQWLAKTLAIRCDYDVMLTTATVSLGLLPEIFTVSSMGYASAEHLPDEMYNPWLSSSP